MKKAYTLMAKIEQATGGGAYVCIPFDVEQVFGKKRVPIRATIDGEAYRGTLVRMGTPGHILAVLKEIRGRIGKDIGDEVEVVLEEDTAVRVVEIPDDFRRALATEPGAQQAFQKLSYTRQKEMAGSIEEAKKAETRQARIVKAMTALRNSG